MQPDDIRTALEAFPESLQERAVALQTRININLFDLAEGKSKKKLNEIQKLFDEAITLLRDWSWHLQELQQRESWIDRVMNRLFRTNQQGLEEKLIWTLEQMEATVTAWEHQSRIAATISEVSEQMEALTRMLTVE